jgi:hypothetical protein
VLAHSLADVLGQYRELGRLLDAKSAHERAERAERAARQEARENVATAAPILPTRGQDGRFVAPAPTTVAATIREAMLSMRGLP